MISNINSSTAINAMTDDVRRRSSVEATQPTTETSASVDTLEISQEAKLLRQGNASDVKPMYDDSRTQRIKEQIASGFYNSPTVQRSIASKLSEVIMGSI